MKIRPHRSSFGVHVAVTPPMHTNGVDVVQRKARVQVCVHDTDECVILFHSKTIGSFWSVAG
jgi:hypothetical protein